PLVPGAVGDGRLEFGLDRDRGARRGARVTTARLARRLPARTSNRDARRSRTRQESCDRPLPPPKTYTRPSRRQAAPPPAHPHVGATRSFRKEHIKTCGKGTRSGRETRRATTRGTPGTSCTQLEALTILPRGEGRRCRVSFRWISRRVASSKCGRLSGAL